MGLTDKQILEKLTSVLWKIHSEKRITAMEFDKILFYGTYNNEHVAHVGIDDLGENNETIIIQKSHINE